MTDRIAHTPAIDKKGPFNPKGELRRNRSDIHILNPIGILLLKNEANKAREQFKIPLSNNSLKTLFCSTLRDPNYLG